MYLYCDPKMIWRKEHSDSFFCLLHWLGKLTRQGNVMKQKVLVLFTIFQPLKPQGKLFQAECMVHLLIKVREGDCFKSWRSNSMGKCRNDHFCWHVLHILNALLIISSSTGNNQLYQFSKASSMSNSKAGAPCLYDSIPLSLESYLHTLNSCAF